LATAGEKEALQSLVTEVTEEINVKQLVVVTEAKERERFAAGVPGYSVANDAKYWVAVDMEMPPELVAEGLSRELVRHLQNMRRNAGLDITDHIATYYQTEDPVIRQVIRDFAGYIKQETLSEDIIESAPPDDASAGKHRISSGEISLAIKKTNP
jgi:isoleucyl-tRNA synthetase